MAGNPISWKLSRAVLTLNSDIWDFHASWCRFVSRDNDNRSDRRHVHSIYEMHYIVSGCMTVQLQDQSSVRLTAGHFILIPPHICHKFSFDAEDARKMVTGFSIKTENAAILSSLQSCSRFSAIRASDTLAGLVQALWMKMEGNLSMTPHIVVMLLQCLVLECLEILTPAPLTASDGMLKHSRDDIRLDQARRYIDTHVTSVASGTEVAQDLGISYRHLNRLYRTSYGCSVFQYIQKERVAYAQRLLETSPLNMNDIAESMNFSSVYAFIRFFRNNVGVTPGKYRKDASRR